MATELEARRLLISVMYEGPWERLMNWLLGIDPKTNEVRWHVSNDGVVVRLADRLEARHRRWVNRYATRGTHPHRRWARRVRPE